MPERIEKVREVQQHTNEAIRGRDLTRESAKRESEKLPAFIEQPMRDAGLLQKDQYLTKSTDGQIHLQDKEESGIERPIDLKNLAEVARKDNPVQYEQAKYEMIKHALSENIQLDTKFIKGVEKVEGGYNFKYDLNDKQGTKEEKLSLVNENTKKRIEAFEKQMADHGFQIEEPRSESLKKAILKNAAEKGLIKQEDQVAVQSYDPKSEKWYISKNGRIEEFSLDNSKIEQDAELESLKRHLKLKNGNDIVEAKFKNGQSDQYEVRGRDIKEMETISKKDVDQSIMNKIMGETKITPASEVKVIESRETDSEAKIRKIDQLLDDLKKERKKVENMGNGLKKTLRVMSFLNQGFVQADTNLNIIEEALHLGGGNNGNIPTTIQSSEMVINAFDEKHKSRIKEIDGKIKHLESFKLDVNKQKSKLESETKKYEKLKEDLMRSRRHSTEKEDANYKRKQGDENLTASDNGTHNGKRIRPQDGG